MDFEDYLGKFPQHCHILDHEDHEMMRQFQTINPRPATCADGNNTCDPGEDCVSCPEDCAQVSGASCGNGLCEMGDGEDCNNCPEDCAGKAKGKNAFCCGGAIGCGDDANDNRCIDASAGLACRVEARLSACCGDALCEGEETETSCANDCAAACVETEPTEVSCFDTVDNDCDAAIDCADTDCNNASTPTTCGVGACERNGTLDCQSGDLMVNCTPGIPVGEGPFGDATCSDGSDNDCDGLTDTNDPDCDDPGGVTCSDITKRKDCNNEPACTWDGGTRTCVDAP
jgi:hypothetical protein